MTGSDTIFMRRALKLARRGLGRTSPNPMVGAVVVNEGEVVGEGWHLYASRDHAEVVALRRAGRRARGAELFVTLEPCSHHGRTPPCVESILAAGISRVVAAVTDPNPQVSGRGLEQLRQAGLQVESGLFEAEARELNCAYFHSVSRHRPLVTLKLAMSLDGRIALSTGISKWITGDPARRWVQQLRWSADAVAVGIGTVLADDPALDVRIRGGKPIWKVVLDSRLRCPQEAKLLAGDRALLCHAASAPEVNRRNLANRADLLEIPAGTDGLSWPAVLDALDRRQVQSLLLEGGGKLAAGALKSAGVDRVALFYSPRFFGADAFPAVGPLGLSGLEQASRFRLRRIRRLGQDFLVEATLDPA